MIALWETQNGMCKENIDITRTTIDSSFSCKSMSNRLKSDNQKLSASYLKYSSVEIGPSNVIDEADYRRLTVRRNDLQILVAQNTCF